MLILGVRGVVSLLVGDRPVEVVPGRLTVLPSGLEHRGLATLTDSAAYYWMHFVTQEELTILSDEEADTILSSPGVASARLDDAALFPLLFDLAEPEPWFNEFRALLTQQETPAYTRWKFQLMFQSLLIHGTEAALRGHQPSSEPSRRSSVVYGVLAEVAAHLTDPNLSLKGIATSLGLHPDYLGRRFKEVMGLSVGVYLLNERLRLARIRLEQSQDSLARIASGCGFGTLRHFLRQFKGQFGATPTEVRNRYRTMHVNSM